MKRLILVLFSLVFATVHITASSHEENEMVMTEGMKIMSTTKNGEIAITAGNSLHRIYTWDGASREATLWPRKRRWYGSFGAYYPGPGFHWEEHKGIRRGVLDEGQQHFNSMEEVIAWLQLPSHSNCVYRDNGLVVCFSKYPDRNQINVSVWQIYIEGKTPAKVQESAGDRIWVYNEKSRPAIFKDNKNKIYYIGGHKPSKIPGSQNEKIKVIFDK